MSIELPVTLKKAPTIAFEAKPMSSAWFETAIAVLFTATAVLFVSFVAVMTGIV
jgi:hypothetical protein